MSVESDALRTLGEGSDINPQLAKQSLDDTPRVCNGLYVGQTAAVLGTNRLPLAQDVA